LFMALGTLIISVTVNSLGANGVDLGRWNHGLSLADTLAVAMVLWLIGTRTLNRRYK